MAVEARQQFLESAASLCNGGNAVHSSLGCVDGRGGRSVLEFYLNPFHKQQQQQQQQRASDLLSCPPSSSSSSSSSPKIMASDLAYCLALQMSKQKQEIDEFLRLHNDQLRSALQRQMRDQILALTRRLDWKASALMKQKEEDLARASKKTVELEECLRRAEEEGQTWKRIAKEKEAMAAALQSTLQQVRDNACRSYAIAALEDDAASCCDSNGAVAGGFRDVLGQGKAVLGRCRGCGCQDSCMLFMPCMHLCACLLCASLLDSCPVCRSAKQGSIEVFLP